MAVKPKWGEFMWGDGTIYGYGDSNPGSPFCPVLVAPRVMSITTNGVIQINVGQITETITLQASDLSLWDVRFDGTTGLVTTTSGSINPAQTLQLEAPNGNLWDILVTPAGVLQTSYNSNIAPAQFVVEVGSAVSFITDDSIVRISDGGVVSVLTGFFADESYVLSSPNGTLWTVLFNGTTGAVTLTDGAIGPAVSLQRTSPHGTVWTFSVDNNGLISVASDMSPFTYEPSRALSISSAGIVAVVVGSPNETYTLTDSANALWWLEVDGTTGLLKMTSLATGTAGTLLLPDPSGVVWALVPTTLGVLQAIPQVSPYTGYVTIVPTYTKENC